MGRPARMADPRILFRAVQQFVECEENRRTKSVGIKPFCRVLERFVQFEQCFTVNQAGVLHQISVPCLAAQKRERYGADSVVKG